MDQSTIPRLDCFPVQLILVIITIILYIIIIYIYDFASVLIFSVRILPRRSYHGVRFSRVESFGFDEFEMMGIVECYSRISDLVSGIALVYVIYTCFDGISNAYGSIAWFLTVGLYYFDLIELNFIFVHSQFSVLRPPASSD